MADRLTQLQDAIDNQLTLMYAALTYVQTRHPYGDIPGQPSQAPPSAPTSVPNSAAPQSAVSQLTNGNGGRQESQQPNGPSQSAQADAVEPPGTPPPEQPEAFEAALHELAQGLVLQEQQIEILINSLPGLGSSEADQLRRMRELEAELREVEKERAVAEEERDRMVDALGEMIVKVQRVP